jgi:transcriptional regulator with XRE-family HTH domain
MDINYLRLYILAIDREDLPVALDMYTLGRRIAAARELRDLTQHELAARAGLTQATIARLEKGRKPGLRLETIVAIAEALGVSLDALVSREAEGDVFSATIAR